MRLPSVIAAALVCVVGICAVGARSAFAQCPRYQKVCLVAGDPPVPGRYEFKRAAGALTVGKTKKNFVFRDFRLRLGHRQGCPLNGRFVNVLGVHPVKRMGKSSFIGVEETETIFTWRLLQNHVTVLVGEKTYPGLLFAKFLNLGNSGGPQTVEGFLNVMAGEDVLCKGRYFGRPG